MLDKFPEYFTDADSIEIAYDTTTGTIEIVKEETMTEDEYNQKMQDAEK